MASVDVYHREARLDLYTIGFIETAAPDVDLDVCALIGDSRCQLPDIHVHAAAIADARLGQGRRVKRDDSKTSHGSAQRSIVGR